MKLALISHVQYDTLEGKFNDILLQRAVYRLTRYIKPDAVCLQGAFLTHPCSSDAPQLWTRLLEILKLLECPLMVYPDNTSSEMMLHFQDIAHTELPELLKSEDVTTILNKAPVLCESPFTFQLLEFNSPDKLIAVENCDLKLPEDLQLMDCHIHTPIAYCSEDLEMTKTVALAAQFGLKAAVCLEHSGQLYYNSPDYWSGAYDQGWPDQSQIDRTADFTTQLELAQKLSTIPISKGFELDINTSGDIVIQPEALSATQVRLGAIHYLHDQHPVDMKHEFMFKLKAFLNNGIDIFAHPFRIFKWKKHQAPRDLFEPVANLLKEYNTAVELNFHSNSPDVDFFEVCIKKGVKIAFGSDSHHLYEIGEFYPHLKLFEQLDAIDNIDNILYRPIYN